MIIVAIIVGVVGLVLIFSFGRMLLVIRKEHKEIKLITMMRDKKETIINAEREVADTELI